MHVLTAAKYIIESVGQNLHIATNIHIYAYVTSCPYRHINK